MNKTKVKQITIISLLVLILIIICSIYIFKNYKYNDNNEENNKLNYDLELKEDLLPLMKEELSTSWHRYDNWENKIDNNPYIICKENNKLVASIKHEEYGDIYFVFSKIDDKYYVKEYGDKIADWQNYCH